MKAVGSSNMTEGAAMATDVFLRALKKRGCPTVKDFSIAWARTTQTAARQALGPEGLCCCWRHGRAALASWLSSGVTKTDKPRQRPEIRGCNSAVQCTKNRTKEQGRTADAGGSDAPRPSQRARKSNVPRGAQVQPSLAKPSRTSSESPAVRTPKEEPELGLSRNHA